MMLRSILPIIAFSLCAMQGALAATIVSTGADGASPGAPGGPAFALANGPEAINSATATGGKGAPGAGASALGGAGGPGGAGGGAGAEAITNVASGNATAFSLATGGQAGPGGGTFLFGLDHTGSGGNGGFGADAIASASAITGTNSTVQVDAGAVGGSGGGGPARANGGRGGNATLGTVYGSSAGGPVQVTGVAAGGSGEASLQFDPGDAGSGGDGADVSLTDIVDGDTAGDLVLVQTARGGSGGNAIAGVAGRGGDTFSSLSRSKNAASLTVKSFANFAHAGGAVFEPGGTTGRGGHAAARSEATNGTGSAKAESVFLGGHGGVSFGGTAGGAGGNATGSAVAMSMGDGHRVDALGQGGVGGNGGDSNGGLPGRGGDSTFDLTGTATGDSFVFVQGFSGGGTGGYQGTAGVTSGTGGNGTCTATATNAGPGVNGVLVQAYAGGGDGGDIADAASNPPPGGGGAGGEAIATGTGTSAGAANVLAQAYGGNANAGGVGGRGKARADATGSSGFAETSARSNGGPLTALFSFASSQVSGLTRAESRTAVAAAAPASALAEALEVANFSTGTPGGSEVSTALAGNPYAASTLPAGSDALALVVAAAKHPASGTFPGRQARAEFRLSVDTAKLATSRQLKVAFLDPQVGGAGFSSLRVSIAAGTTGGSFTQLFSDVPSALAFFEDSTLDLGAIASGLGGGTVQSITVALDIVTSAPGDSFSVNYLVANAAPTAPKPVAFVTHPQSQTHPAGGAATFRVAASGTPPLSYQWFRGTDPIPGATAATLTLSPLQVSASGTLRVTVTNAAGSADSDPANLTVYGPPQISTPPGAVLVRVGGRAEFSVAATSAVAPSYQWRKGTTPLAGETGNMLVIDPVTVGAAGNYSVVVTNPAGSTPSSAAALTLETGPLTVTINPPGAGGVTAGFAGTTQQTISADLEITATANAGFVFVGWTGDFPTADETLSFNMPATAAVQAEFAPYSIADARGSYTGLVLDAPVAHVSSGLLTIATVGSGSFTGKAIVGGVSYPLAGKFDPVGQARFGPGRDPVKMLPRSGGQPALELRLNMALAPTITRIVGTVTEPDGFVADISANRALFTARPNPVPPMQNVPPELLGKFTALLPVDPAGAGLPRGDGWATVKVNAAGKARVAGQLADGTPIKFRAALAPDATLPIYLPLYRKAGSIVGPVAFSDETASDLAGTLAWFKPAPAWPDGCTVALAGSRYLPPAPGARVLASLDANGGAATVALTDGGLPEPLQQAINVSSANRVTLADPLALHRLKLTIDASTGKFSGDFRAAPGDPATIFSGVFLQKTIVGGGSFAGATESGLVRVLPVP